MLDATHQEAFNKCKKLAGNSARLTNFNTKKPVVLTTDASPYGLAGCLSHKITTNGKIMLHPIAYASASLKASEKNYAQIDLEGLAIYWAIQHFRQYLWCQQFELHTDCSALVKIFGPKNDLNGCASGRLNRWAAALMEYNFTIKHIKGSSNCTADSLSRLPVCLSYIRAPYPPGSVYELSRLPTSVNSIEIILDADELMVDVQDLACWSEEAIATVSISQVIGYLSKEA